MSPPLTLSFQVTQAHSLPSLPPPRRATLSVSSSLKLSLTAATCKAVVATPAKTIRDFTEKIGLQKFALEIQVGALLAAVEQPAFAVTGVNNEEDFTWVLIQLGIVAFLYFLVAPPIIMNWLRIRWYRRNFFEMYLQFMFVFMFFPGILLWAPFLNFRKFPRDPSLKYPWSQPENPAQVKNAYFKYPFAKAEDYD